MKQVVKYTAVDPYYSDQCQTYIGTSSEEISIIRVETEDAMKGEHYSLSTVYKAEVVYDDSVRF